MKAFLTRVRYALHGWSYFFRKEANGQIQMVLAILVIVAGFVFKISLSEWLVVLLCIGSVLGLEMVNTAIETFANRLHPERHPEIKVVKDVAAGAVLWMAVISVMVGIVIFLPRILELIS